MPSLYRRLTVTHTIVAVLAVLVVTVLAGGLVLRAYDQLARDQARIAEGTAVTLLGELYRRRGSWEGVGRSLQTVIDERPLLLAGRRMLLADEHWQVLYDSSEQMTGQALPLRLRPTALPVPGRGGPVGYVVVLAGGDNRTLEERGFVRSILGILLAGSLAGAAFALLMGLLMARRLVMPLRSMTAAARRLAAGERHQPLAVPGEAELADLAVAFNSMAAELGRQEELRRNMTADIAHELRTPLSVLRLQIESLQDGIAAPTPERLEALALQTTVLGRLIDDLRLLSLADAGQLSLQCEEVEPRRALEAAVLAAAPQARERGIELCLAPGPALPAIYADPQRLAQILGNLVENGLRYTPAGGIVTLAADLQQGTPAGGKMAVLSVSDSGPGIAAEDLPLIFDRFYRADRARARETGGSGLGLAIVQRLVEAQHGTIQVQSTPGRGATFRVLLPVSEKE